MSLPEAAKRRANRRSSSADDGHGTRRQRDGPPNGVYLIAALAFLGGAVDLLLGLAMLPTSFVVFGVLLATIGGLECWAAVGLFRLRARALGLAVVLFGAGALIDGLRLLFALGSGGAAGGPAARILLAVVVIGYLLARADHFE
ncbi:hypothetical protein [Halorubrum lipolyticum]|uniref:Uncharacterized protein n=1 Tax=Halorubrum lipolyticum DSM 21995 TaxID=1227482 RepID=M0NX76_9EURY|nr:hypothetical protein [Halorubrum lipolyticum]EMA61185.1 hypothetical protein C469_07947 [Halorubrum lipolyticum DSM 21995]